MSKDPHIIDLPKKVVVGTNVIDRIPEILMELGLHHKAHIITGPTVKGIVGEYMSSLLSEKGIPNELSTAKSSFLHDVEEVLEEVKRSMPSVIIGLGGGKSIDTAKYVSSHLYIPFISVPTAASHDGIASPFASIRGLNRITSIKAAPPVAIVADLSVISQAPPRLLKAGAGDLIGKFTAVLDWRLAHRLKGEYYGEYAASLSLLSAKHVMNATEIIATGGKAAASLIIEGLVSSSVAMCIAGSSRPASGSEHLFSHALDKVANYPALHGEQVAVGTIMMTYLHGRNWKLLRARMRKMGLPTTAKELGVRDVDVIEALTIAHKIRPERYTILGESGLTYEAAEELARTTGVID